MSPTPILLPLPEVLAANDFRASLVRAARASEQASALRARLPVPPPRGSAAPARTGRVLTLAQAWGARVRVGKRVMTPAQAGARLANLRAQMGARLGERVWARGGAR